MMNSKDLSTPPRAGLVLAGAMLLLFGGVLPACGQNPPGPPFRGLYFNPDVRPDPADFPWLLFYPRHRDVVRKGLADLAKSARINLVDVIVCLPHTLMEPAKAPPAGAPWSTWASPDFVAGLATFIDDCHEAGIAVEVDLANNMWIPATVDPSRHIANTGRWPRPDETPWDESATWYRGIIEAVESRARHPEAIAMWCMMGNYQLGGAEPCLWDRDDNPAILAATEPYVKRVWPLFRKAGKRPKAAPIMLPIMSSVAYWQARTPASRLSAFTRLKKWIVDDLALPPDYWVMTTWPFCDPAPDGFPYLRTIVEILGPAAATRLISTDFKGPGHDEARDSIVSLAGRSGPEMLEWHFRKCAQYHLAGWWIWCYRDSPNDRSGMADADGRWKPDLLPVLRRQADVGK